MLKIRCQVSKPEPFYQHNLQEIVIQCPNPLKLIARKATCRLHRMLPKNNRFWKESVTWVYSTLVNILWRLNVAFDTTNSYFLGQDPYCGN
jgi:arginyl-tRNA synthetase